MTVEGLILAPMGQGPIGANSDRPPSLHGVSASGAKPEKTEDQGSAPNPAQGPRALPKPLFYCPRMPAVAKRTASSAARTSASALLAHSVFSESGTES